MQYAAEVARRVDPQERLQKELKQKTLVKETTFGKIFEVYCIKQLSQNRSGKDVQSIFTRYFLPPLADKAITEIDRRDISKIVTDIMEKGNGYASNRALSNIKTFFRWTVSEGYLSGDPTSVMKKPFKGEISRERVLENHEVKLLWRCFEQLPTKPLGDALKLLMLLGQRRNEVGRMKWEDINLEKGVWDLPREATKNKQPHKVPLLGLALEIIKSQPRIITKDSKSRRSIMCPYVFSTTGTAPVSGWSKTKIQILDNLLSQQIVLPDWRLHDFRRTVSTKLGDLGYHDTEIGMLLNHTSRGVTSVYNRSDYFKKKEEMLRAWDKLLKDIIDEKPGENSLKAA